MATDGNAVLGVYHGREVARHYGDPEGEYRAAVEGMAVFERGHRTRLRVSGRSPAEMLGGVVTGSIPALPTEGDDGVREGMGTYHAILTPKGRVISDAWMLRIGADDGAGFLLDVPVAGRDGLLAHLARFLPPRLARVQDVSEEVGAISVVGPDAADALAKLALGLRVDGVWLQEAEEGRWRAAGDPASAPVVMRTEDVWPPAWNVYGPSDAMVSLRDALVREGARRAGLGVWSTLRVEAGRPVYGTDMDESTLLPEAGVVDRAVDHGKGCYTGQEVIVRIRDRGHVNRMLRRLDLGDVPAPASGTELLAPDGSGKVVGTITSVVQSPRSGGVLALAYVRRGVERVLLDGREVSVPGD